MGSLALGGRVTAEVICGDVTIEGLEAGSIRWRGNE